MAVASLFAACSHSAKHTAASRDILVQGRVTYTGVVPEPRTIAVPGHLRKVFPEGLTLRPLAVDATGGLAEALVYVVNPPVSRPSTLPVPATLLVSNTVCSPRVLAVQTNQDVRFRFVGAQMLNVNATPRVNRGFNIAVAGDGQETVKRFAHPELQIRVADNLHPWLLADISVFDHPWFAVTDSAGRFQLPPLPAGAYDVVVLHRRAGSKRTTIQVAAKLADLELELTGAKVQAVTTGGP